MQMNHTRKASAVPSSMTKLPELSRAYLLKFLLDARTEQGLSISGLEKLAEIPTDSVRDFVRGKALNLRADKLQKILKALGYDLVIQPSTNI